MGRNGLVEGGWVVSGLAWMTVMRIRQNIIKSIMTADYFRQNVRVYIRVIFRLLFGICLCVVLVRFFRFFCIGKYH
jgi:hypothetical protein